MGLACFGLVYAAVAARLVMVSVWDPRQPNAASIAALTPDTATHLHAPDRATIESRNGRVLAVSLPAASLYADPKQVKSAKRAVERLHSVLKNIDVKRVRRLLNQKSRGFVYLDRHLTAKQELQVNRLGIPGLHFQKTWRRHYPQGPLAAHIIGGVTPDQNGISGVEAYFDKRLKKTPAKPLRLSIDLPAQTVVQDTLRKVVKEWKAAGACGIVESMTGRVVAMASLPEYNANHMHDASPHAMFNRCVSGDYEPGSVMKTMTLSMALQSGMLHDWDRFNTTHPLTVDGFAVTDYEPVHRWLAMPAILAYSSNIGASRIATILGPKIQRAWLRKMGFFRKSPIQLPSAQPPLWHPKDRWHLLTTMTASFGNGIAMSPIIMANAVTAIANGGILYKPTLLAHKPGTGPRQGVRVMTPHVARLMRKMMRGVVLAGTGKYAKVHGYLVGGKTGTSQVVGAHGTYRHHLNDSSFIAMFPAPHPRFVVYVVVIKPHPTKAMKSFSHGFTTGGYVAAPAVGHIIRRIGPMFGVLAYKGKALHRENKTFRIPLKPAVPKGAVALGPGHPLPKGANRYAYALIKGRKAPKTPDKAAQREALQRVEMAVPNAARSSPPSDTRIALR